MSRDNKLISGITLAIIKKLIAKDSAEYYEQNRNELYAILSLMSFSLLLMGKSSLQARNIRLTVRG